MRDHRAGDNASGHTGGAVLPSKDDPDYRTLLAMCEAGGRRLDEIKRFDMPGFRPRPEYLRELKRYGVLPPSFDAVKDPIDVYALDRAYWDLFGWRGIVPGTRYQFLEDGIDRLREPPKPPK